MIPKTWAKPPGSPYLRWPGDTGASPRRSPSSMLDSVAWWQRPPPSFLRVPPGRGYGPRGRATDRGGRQPPEAREGGLLRQPVRGLARGGVLRQGGQPSSQQGRQSGREPRPAPDLCRAYAGRGAHPSLRREAHGGGRIQEGDHEVPETLRGPGGLWCPDLERQTRRFLRGRRPRRGRDGRHLTYRGVAT